MAQLPFTARMFPHAATVQPESYSRGETGAPTPAGAPGSPLACNVQCRSQEAVRRLPIGDGGGSVSSEQEVYVTFPADPGVVEDDLITPVAPAPFAGIALACVAPARAVLRGAAFRVTCTART